MTAQPCRHLLRDRLSRVTVLALLTLPLALGPSVVAAAPPPRSETQEEARQREADAAGALDESSREVQAAAVALREVAAELPVAEQAVARAQGEQAGAQAKLTAARAAVVAAEGARRKAEQQVSVAGGRVEQGRAEVGALARRSYQRGRLGPLQDVMEAGEPQDVLERASMLRSVFRYQDESLERLTRDRLTLSRTKADLSAEERAVEGAREVAAQGEARARQITAEAAAAAARVSQLIANRSAALAVAEVNREQDRREYEAAQEASRALAERIRAAAAAAEAARQAELKRQAEAEARRQAEIVAARQRAARAGRPAPPPPPPVQRAPAASARTGDLLWPAPGRLSSRFGMRKHPIYGDYRMHNGIDIAAPNGTRISATETGTVLFAGPSGGYGNFVVISHGMVNGKNLASAYAHLSTINVTEGQVVARGAAVGAVGNTGASTGNHLHFEIRRDGDPVDPLDYVSPP